MPVVRIALDAMGGDHAPAATVLGAIEATGRLPDLEVALVGDRAQIEAELEKAGAGTARLTIVHASQVIGNEDPATDAVRKTDSSIRRGAELVGRGDAHGLVAAGNTGAAVAAATVVIRLLPKVKRAGIAVPLPTSTGRAILCDAGANIHCKPLHLYHYGLMAAQYARHVLGKENPTVGLLNIGSEEGKGTDLVRETAALFAHSPLNFVGNIEGNDVFPGRCDVIVCEGFVGNVVLKTAEGLSEMVETKLRSLLTGLASSDPVRAGGLGDLLRRFRDEMDYAEHGGAPLLGLNGLVLISHGRSDARAIRNALLQAARMHEGRVIHHMAEELRSSADLGAR
jgi:glycerol-3-phosphate acyltransferase PlsX